MKLLGLCLFICCCWFYVITEESEKFDINELEKLVPQVIRTDKRNNVIMDIIWERGSVTKLKDVGIGKIGLTVSAGKTMTAVKKEIIRFFAKIFEIKEEDIKVRVSKTDFHKTVVLNKKAISAYNAMDKIMEAIDTMPVDSSKVSEEIQESTTKRRYREMDRILEAIDNIQVDK